MVDFLRNFHCAYPECSAEFGTKYNLKRHIDSRHLHIKRFSCDICGLQLASKQTRQEHLYTHSGEKPFRCIFENCTKAYRQSSQLSIHRKLHMARLLRHNTLPTLELNPFKLPEISAERSNEQRGLLLPCSNELANYSNR